MFRKLYWVTEQLDADGRSTVTGVYTSIPDLVDKGLSFVDACPKRNGLRLTLLKLDAPGGTFGTWSSPSFEGIEEALAPFVASHEFSLEETGTLAHRLRDFSAAAV